MTNINANSDKRKGLCSIPTQGSRKQRPHKPQTKQITQEESASAQATKMESHGRASSLIGSPWRSQWGGRKASGPAA